jgi:DNA-binding LacI/PurR family transcriptional regulator
LSTSRKKARRRPATSHDVARLAGVSRSAVSRTFTDGASVSPDTRKKVLSAARALKYRPNLFARSLITRRSYILGIAISSFDNHYYPEFVQRLSEEFAKVGYRLLLFVTHGSVGPDPLVDELLKYRLDALILASSTVSSALAAECRDAGVPVLMFNNIDPTSDVPSMAADNTVGGRTIAAFLLAGGHRSFGYVGGIEGDSTTYERESAFASYVTQHGHAAPVRAYSDFHFEGAVQAARTLLKRKERPDALFCTNDLLALAALQVAEAEFGLQPGKDISILGFDNVPIAKWPCFGLTSYSQPLGEIVARVIELVCNALDNKIQAETHDRIRGDLMVRTSARVPSTGLIRLADGDTIWRPARPLE